MTLTVGLPEQRENIVKMNKAFAAATIQSVALEGNLIAFAILIQEIVKMPYTRTVGPARVEAKKQQLVEARQLSEQCRLRKLELQDAVNASTATYLAQGGNLDELVNDLVNNGIQTECYGLKLTELFNNTLRSKS
jgi:hypothetical protein